MYIKNFLSILVFCSLSLAASEVLNSEDQELTSFNASQLHLGQDEGVESFGLQIRLGEKDDMIYPNLLWHYRMGCRNFEIVHLGLSESQEKKIKMFYDRVIDNCSLNALTQQEGSEFASTLPSSLRWILQLTDRQILCLHKPLAEILSERTSALRLPSCTYSGFDPNVPVGFWPQTDEQLIYRSSINYEQSVSLLNRTSSGDAEISNAAHIATFTTMDEAVRFSSGMVRDQLPFMKVIKQSIYHANLGGKDYWTAGDFVRPIVETPSEHSLQIFLEEVGAPDNTRFGKNYIYVVNEKCGCNTITRALGSYEADRLLEFPEPRGFHRPPFEIAERYQRLLSNEFFKFTCVRNPFSRVLSAYLDKIAKVKEVWTRDSAGRVFLTRETWPRQDLGFNIYQKISFEQFLRRLKEKSLKELNDHFKPMWCVTMLPIVPYDKIVHLEKFDQEFQEVMSQLGLPGKPGNYFSAEHATKAAVRKSDYYSQREVNLVLDLCKKDFELLGYSTIPDFPLMEDMDTILLL
ncbi:MAG: sulfotransferase family 2 domain-containing protein [Proteobacteria bacterium]|nr:sulfotransferase family 2 domain-containing protein [Pseudomonadota bacterium]